MRNIAIIFFVFISPYAFSQDSIQSFKNTIRIYPAQIATNREYIISYERAIAPRNSMEVFASYYAAEYSRENDRKSKWLELLPASGFAVKLTFKQFFKKNTHPFGIYHGPVLMYKYVQIFDHNYRETYFEWNGREEKQVFAFEYLLGFQMPIFKHFSAGGYCGLGFRQIYNSFVTNYSIWQEHDDPEIGYVPYLRRGYEEFMVIIGG